MQRYDFDIIGTHLALSLDTTEDCSEIFGEIESRLRQFEAKYSRFLEGNWLHDLNQDRRATLDSDGMSMLSYMLDLSKKTDGYFDPTVGKRLTELGYGKPIINYE